MDNFTQMQMNDTREIDVTTPDKADSQHFTPEQIDEYCKTIHGFTTPPMTGTEVWLVRGVQIIRQLQEERQNLRFDLSDYQVEFGDLP